MPAQNGRLALKVMTLERSVSRPKSEKCPSGRVATLSNNCAAALRPTPVKIRDQVTQLIVAPPILDGHRARPRAWERLRLRDHRTCSSPSPRNPPASDATHRQIPRHLGFQPQGYGATQN